MKVAIVTITHGQNYGNRLQNYAVQETLRKIGISVETLNSLCGIDRTIKTKIKDFLKKTIFSYKYTMQNNRKKIFDKYNKENIKMSKYTVDNNKISNKINNEYDYFICGSDQIWNSNYDENDYIYFLGFADRDKSIAFAPSFGTSQILEKKKEKIKKWIDNIGFLSIREDAGKGIIEQLTGRTDVQVLVDPTMLLTSKEWKKISKRPKQLNTENYILNYFLGELSRERQEEINRIANKMNCEIINILDKNSPFYETGPSEFLYLEENAKLICTDSFHSSVFAMIFNKPFIVFEREDNTVSMNSRIETLLSKFKLEDRYYNGQITENLLKCNYTESYRILEEERKKSNQFLKKALNV